MDPISERLRTADKDSDIATLGHEAADTIDALVAALMWIARTAKDRSEKASRFTLDSIADEADAALALASGGK